MAKQPRDPGGGPFDDWLSHADVLTVLIQEAERVRRVCDDGEELFELEIDRRPLGGRFDNLQVLEYALQHYVCENPADLGFVAARGPYARGPDVHVRKRGRKWEHAEVEVRAGNYLRHGHNGDPAFSKVKYLMVPEQSVPLKLRQQLPKEIVMIKRDRFVPWWQEYRRRGGAADRSREARAGALFAVQADLAQRVQDCVVTDARCTACGITAIFRVEQPEAGFSWPDDRVDLSCPKCGTLLRTMKGVGTPRLVEVVPELRDEGTRTGLLARWEEEQREDVPPPRPPRRRSKS